MTIPADIREPFTAVEFDSSQAQQTPSRLSYRGLIVGQKLVAGTGAADTLVRIASVDQAITIGGRGSMLHRQALAWFAINKSTELWIGILSDNVAGVAAQGTIVVGGPATKDGTIPLYLGGERITIGVASGAASTAIATAIRDAINANLDLPVTASAASSTVTLTYRHKGEVGNQYDMRDCYRDGESLPAGVTLTYTAMGTAVAGTTNPTLTNLIAAMADLWFQIWTHGFTDATSLSALETELALRFGPLRAQDGIAITSKAGSFATLTTLGSGRNSKHTCIVAQPGPNPLTPPIEFAAETAAALALEAAVDPARPMQTVSLVRALPPPETDLFSFEERNLLLYEGISTTWRVAGGGVQIARLITTYQTSPAGADDTAYLDVTTVLTLLFLRYDFRSLMQRKFPRHKLADDSAVFGAGQLVMTPLLGKAVATEWFEDMQELGLVEGYDQFKRDLVCKRSLTDPNRLEFTLPPDLINQLIVTAATIQFRV